ncbi:MAG: ATP-binding protein [bacterium]
MSISVSSWPSSAIGEWVSLRRERDPELYWEGLLGLAQRQENEGNLEIAATLYSEFAAGISVPPALARRARERLELLRGGGSFGARAEFLMRRFVDSTADPAMLLAMGTAGLVFRLGRTACLARMAAGEAHLLTRGVISRGLASVGAFVLEAPAFTLSSRLGNAVLGRPQDWSAGAWARDLASSYLTLGGLRLAGWAGTSLHRRFGAGPLPGLGQQFYRQGSMFAGIMLGHRLEEWAGLRTPHPASSPLVDSLVTLLQFNVGGRLVRTAFGSGLEHWGSALEARAESLAANRPVLMAMSTRPQDLNPSLAAAGRDPTRGEGPSLKATLSSDPPHGEPRIVKVETGSFAETIRMLDELIPDFPSEKRIQVRLPEDFPRQISEWGDSFLENTRSLQAPLREELLRFHERIEDSPALRVRDHRRLRVILRGVQTQLDEFHETWRILRKAAKHAAPFGERDPETRQSLRLVLHDLQYRAEPLTMAKFAIEGLASGNPLRPYQRAYLLSPGGGYSASGAIKDGLAKATSEVEEVFQWVGQDWHQGFLDELKFAQGRDPTRAAGDILANLLTNAWRYRSSDSPRIRMNTEALPGGGLRVSVRDDGIGILPEHLLDLGGSGFREGRKQVAGSQGLGLASVLQNLRSLQWGPLWVRSRPGTGTEFRFEIPAEAFQGATPSRPQVDARGLGPETSLENNLSEGFVVPAASMDLAIRQMLRDLPGIRNSLSLSPFVVTSWIEALANGNIRNRRLEALHRLLSGGRNPSELEVVENGPGVLLDIATSLARLGSRVRVKESDGFSGTIYQLTLEDVLPHSLLERIRMDSPDKLNEPSPADLSYWANPAPSFLARLANSNAEEYLGRDVRPGGFLVIQTDHHQVGGERILPRLDAARWQRIFEATIPNLPRDSNEMLPTGQVKDLHLQVFRRIR